VADTVPSGELALFGFFELLALAFTFEGVSALLSGRPWTIWAPAVSAGILFFLIGVKSRWIRDKLTSIDWARWGRRVDRVLMAVRICLGLGVIAFAYYAWHEVHFARLEYQRIAAPSGQSSALAQPQLPQVQRPSATEVGPNPMPQRSTYLDWREKQNWRRTLHTGMTRTDIRQLFGEPDKVSVISDIEFWHYGTGEVEFRVQEKTDGILCAWFEPD